MDEIYLPYKMLTENKAVEEIVSDILKNEHIKKAKGRHTKKRSTTELLSTLQG